MLTNYFEIVERFLRLKKDHLDRAEIEYRENQLEVKFPESMIDFYEFFGNNIEVLHAYYRIKKLEEFEIQNNGLIFGYGHQDENTFGILLNQMSFERPQIQKYDFNMKNWYVESSSCHRFFLNIACWQVLNTMPCIATVGIKESKLDNILDGKLSIISKERPLYKSYDVYSYYKEESILACYIAPLQELYVSSLDKIHLENIEDELKLELDWV